MPGPKGLLQEKFQRTADPVETEDSHEWSNPNGFAKEFSIRKVYKPSRNEHYASEQGFASDEGSFTMANLNYMPPGMFIDNQEPMVTERAYRYSAAGQTDVSNRVSPKMLKAGFLPNQMSPVDDMYNNEH